MADSPEGFDPGPGPSNDSRCHTLEGGVVPVEPKRKRFRAFHVVRKIFRRKSKHKTDAESKSHSTSELLIVDGTERRSGSIGGTPYSSGLSLSHDSVFAVDSEEKGSGDHARDESRKNCANASRRRFSVKGLKEELMNKLRARQESDDEDPGLPHSPCTSPTTAEVLQQGLMVKSSKFRSSDGSLLSMGSSETDNEESGMNPPRMIFERHRNGDPELDLGPTMLLNHRAAHHRIAVKPRKNHAVPRHRRLHQVTTGSSLPTTPEDAEEAPVTTCDKVGNISLPPDALYASQKVTSSPKKSSSSMSRGRSRSVEMGSEDDGPTNRPMPPSSKEPRGGGGSKSLVAMGNSGSKSHAAERKLQHEISRYGLRMSEKDAEESNSPSVESPLDASRDRRESTPDDADATVSCFGFGHRSKKESPDAPVSEEPKAGSLKKDSGDEPFLSKLFGSRLSGRKKKSDERKRTAGSSPEALDVAPKQTELPSWVQSHGTGPPQNRSTVILNDEHSNRVIISVKSESRGQLLFYETAAGCPGTTESSQKARGPSSTSISQFGQQKPKTEAVLPGKWERNSRSGQATHKSKEATMTGQEPFAAPPLASNSSNLARRPEYHARQQVRKERVQHLSFIAVDSQKRTEETARRYSYHLHSHDGDEGLQSFSGNLDISGNYLEKQIFDSSPSAEDRSLSPDLKTGAFNRGSINDSKRRSVQHQLTKEDIFELEMDGMEYSRSPSEPPTPPSPSARPIRFSLGSAKDNSSPIGSPKSPADPPKGTLESDHVRVAVPSVTPAENGEVTVPSSTEIWGDGKGKIRERQQSASELKQLEPIEICPLPRHSPPRVSADAMADGVPAGVVRLDVSWPNSKDDSEPKAAAASDASKNCVTSAVVTPVGHDSKPCVPTGKEDPGTSAEPEPGTGVRAVPLRRPRPRQNNKTEEPELFKVFHRRSLKLKDSDAPVVTSADTSTGEEPAVAGDVSLVRSDNDAVVDVAVGSPGRDRTLDEPAEQAKVVTERGRSSVFPDKQTYVQLSASRLAKTQDSPTDGQRPAGGTGSNLKERSSVASVVRKMSSSEGDKGPDRTSKDSVKIDHNDNVEATAATMTKSRSGSIQQHSDSESVGQNSRKSSSSPSYSARRTESQSSTDSLSSKSFNYSYVRDEFVGPVRNVQVESGLVNNAVEEAGAVEHDRSVPCSLGMHPSAAPEAFLPSLPTTRDGRERSPRSPVDMLQPPSLQSATVREARHATTPVATENVSSRESTLPGVMIRQKKDVDTTSKVPEEPMRNNRQTESLLIEANSKPPVGRSSKVLDLVRNFQKLQVS